jgi:hypothetical protein
MGTKLLPVVCAFCVKQLAGLVCVSVNSDASWYILFVWVPVSLMGSRVTVHVLSNVLQEHASFIFAGLWSVDILYSSWTVNW